MMRRLPQRKRSKVPTCLVLTQRYVVLCHLPVDAACSVSTSPQHRKMVHEKHIEEEPFVNYMYVLVLLFFWF